MRTKPVTARIEARIHIIRGERVMLDADLAVLYGVQTKALNLAVRRHQGRFPADFVFQLTREEMAGLRFQVETSKVGRGGRRYLPYAFTEHGIAMLSSVLRSDRAVAVNIMIMRTFVQLRRALNHATALGLRVDDLERKTDVHGAILTDILKALKALERPMPANRREIGFRPKGPK